jgi:hypothetical protein
MCHAFTFQSLSRERNSEGKIFREKKLQELSLLRIYKNIPVSCVTVVLAETCSVTDEKFVNKDTEPAAEVSNMSASDSGLV